MAALEDDAGLGDDRILTLAPGQRRILDDPVERYLGSSAKDGENRLVAQKIDGVIPPFTERDHAAVKVHDLAQLASIEGDGRRLAVAGGGEDRDLASPARPRHSGWISVGHGALLLRIRAGTDRHDTVM